MSGAWQKLTNPPRAPWSDLVRLQILPPLEFGVCAIGLHPSRSRYEDRWHSTTCRSAPCSGVVIGTAKFQQNLSTYRMRYADTRFATKPNQIEAFLHSWPKSLLSRPGPVLGGSASGHAIGRQAAGPSPQRLPARSNHTVSNHDDCESNLKEFAPVGAQGAAAVIMPPRWRCAAQDSRNRCSSSRYAAVPIRAHGCALRYSPAGNINICIMCAKLTRH